MLELRHYLGAPVVDATGTKVGTVVDVLANDIANPTVRAVIAADHKQLVQWEWADITAWDRDGVRLAPGATPLSLDALPLEELAEQHFLLRRDVLDTQVIDTVGQRVARVSDVLMSQEGDVVRIVAVDVSMGAVLARMGMHSLSQRVPQKVIAWSDLHLTSDRGHDLQLANEGAAVHKLDARALAHVLDVIPTPDARAILDHLDDETTVKVLAHPRLSKRLLAGTRRFTRHQRWWR